jgi:chromosomal replication initiation ATPase DnaA
MSEELDTLRLRAWELIKAIDNIKANGVEIDIKPIKKAKVYYDPEHIIDECCGHFHITAAELSYARRMGVYVSRRIIAIKLLLEFTKDVTLREICGKLGYKQHGTVLHHLRNFDDILNGKVYDHEYMIRDYEAIKKRLEA